MNPAKLLTRSNISIEFKAGENYLSNYYAYNMDSFRYISHHGILGQKWGIRRYQNKDGTLTEAGKKRYIQSISDTSYTLTKKGIRARDKAYNKLNGKNAHEEMGKKLAKFENDTRSAMYWDTSSKQLESLRKESADSMRKAAQEHMELVKQGKLFTEGYFDTKLSAIKYYTINKLANDTLTSRAKAYELAKKEDKYDLDYLEMQPEHISEASRKVKLRDYEQYLNDPEKWRDKRSSK